MDRVIRSLLESELLVLPDRGIAYLGVEKSGLYDDKYFSHFAGLEKTEFSTRLNEYRISVVDRHTHGFVVDVGCGSGAFIRQRGRERTHGFDVMPTSVKLLESEGLFFDITSKRTPAATFWDSLEHISDPESVLKNVAQFAFISMPIYEDLNQVKQSKHFKPGEHLWYFTDSGLVWWMREHGFRLLERGLGETELGRVSIGTYAFERV